MWHLPKLSLHLSTSISEQKWMVISLWEWLSCVFQTCITIHCLLLTSVLWPTVPLLAGVVPVPSIKPFVSDTISPVFRYKHSSPWKNRCSWLLCKKTSDFLNRTNKGMQCMCTIFTTTNIKTLKQEYFFATVSFNRSYWQLRP